MSPLIGRSLVALSLFFVLSACQNSAQKNQEPTIDEFAVAELVFNTHLAAQELESAGQQLDALRERDPSEPRLDELQQRLATAWLATGEQALKDADIDTASAALMQAKRLLPKAPALTQGLSTALAAVQEPIAEPAAPPVQPSVARKQPLPRLAPAAKKPVKKSVVAQPEAPEIVVEQSQSEELIELTPPVRSKLKARVLDLNAAHTTIALPMLASRNNHQLGRLLDDVAADVVRFRAAVSIEVADTRDFHWVAALLSARVKKLDANFNPRLQEVIRSDEAAQLVITPNLSF